MLFLIVEAVIKQAQKGFLGLIAFLQRLNVPSERLNYSQAPYRRLHSLLNGEHLPAGECFWLPLFLCQDRGKCIRCIRKRTIDQLDWDTWNNGGKIKCIYTASSTQDAADRVVVLRLNPMPLGMGTDRLVQTLQVVKTVAADVDIDVRRI